MNLGSDWTVAIVLITIPVFVGIAGTAFYLLSRRSGHRNFDAGARYVTDAPSVHVHYLVDDEEAERTGVSRVELVCHGCQRGKRVLLTFPPADLQPDGSSRAVAAARVRFANEHRRCPGNWSSLCPDGFVITDEIDLRMQTSTETPPWRRGK